jgi:hypothetical protein
MNDQTYFTWGQPHFSTGHASHQSGSTAPVQQDLQLRYSNGSLYQNLGGVGINTGPGGFQTNLGSFGFGTK